MAKKKKENTLTYLQMPLPESGKIFKMTKLAFGGLNKRYTHDSGELAKESNISTKAYPYLVPSEQRLALDLEKYEEPIGLFAFDDFIIVLYYMFDTEHYVKADYIGTDGVIHTGIVRTSDTRDELDLEISRSIVQFNVYDVPTDPVTGQFIKKLLIFPDKASMFMNIVQIQNINEFKKETADTGILYWHYNTDGNKIYSVVKETISGTDDEGNVTYKREHQAFDSNNYFTCDGMEALVKEYYNDTPQVDESGAIIYPPPDTASHNSYYLNTANILETNYGTEVYAWREYDTVEREEEYGLETDENGDFKKDENSGDYIRYGFSKDKSGNYIPDGGTAYGWKVVIPPAVPDIKYATVHLSRVFGVDDTRVYASGYNDYTNWNLDTVDEYNEANSWCSPSQSNTKAGGNFTGITTFQNHVICFKRDFMHEIYNNKNPFRLQDVYAEGAIANETIQDVDGKLIFVSEDDVKVYTGSNPRIIGYNLNMTKYKNAVSGTDNRNYYLYCEEGGNRHLYVYDTYTDLWSEQSIGNKVISFAHNKNGMYMLCSDGFVYKMDTGDYKHSWSFETDFITNKTVDIKHIKKLQMLVDIPDVINNRNNYGDDKDNPVELSVYILYDNEEFDGMEGTEKEKRLLYHTNKRNGKFPIRVKPWKTANYGFKLHIEGKGYVKLYELEIFVEAGGDLYV